MFVRLAGQAHDATNGLGTISPVRLFGECAEVRADLAAAREQLLGRARRILGRSPGGVP
jgi:hypothetical protein